MLSYIHRHIRYLIPDTETRVKGGKEMKKRVARLMALSMAAAMTASLAACGGGDSGNSGGDGISEQKARIRM